MLIDEAYFEFCGVTALPLLRQYPNLFVSRTFSKVYGMAAMRCGCLFSNVENVRWMHKAQSPYSVNMLAALAARAAMQDREYVANYVKEVLAAREMVYAGLAKLGIPFYPSQANFVLFHAGERAIPIRDALRDRGVLIRDRSYEIAGCVRVTIGNRAADRAFPRRTGGVVDSLIVFDMDGVLAEVTESYREAIVQTVRHFTGKTSHARRRFRITRTRAAGTTIGRSRRKSRPIWDADRLRHRRRASSTNFSWARTATA